MSLRDYTPPPDPMMDELCAIRDAISAQMLTQSTEEQLQSLHHETDEFLAQHGYELRPDPDHPGRERMVKKEA